MIGICKNRGSLHTCLPPEDLWIVAPFLISWTSWLERRYGSESADSFPSVVVRIVTWNLQRTGLLTFEEKTRNKWCSFLAAVHFQHQYRRLVAQN